MRRRRTGGYPAESQSLLGPDVCSANMREMIFLCTSISSAAALTVRVEDALGMRSASLLFFRFFPVVLPSGAVGKGRSCKHNICDTVKVKEHNKDPCL